ncbi:ribonuclease Y [Syntrophobacter fumaroxidans]|uniref:Ribonuclease Y n=1 Tax=Syntrophobacter fumaroxidans (strain DSM 10017 / MPOB) TaxID=335543 RepID=RNY_SYNFM|nr:ribonuclease Y [Syntrophobacter fumaroxidans]A0LLF4.1 RecName: Full=Ribonuclease Y; Short=RNase Y [Syntrophobacter fumaroxidans MPOB]ABK18256.1 metal dependent phosphohydrolase [Syntrophobacter fumaroxidans MPOB]
MGYVSGILLVLIGLLAGVGLGVLLRQYWLEKRNRQLQEQARNILTDARKEAETIKKEAILQAKDSLFQMKAEFERETKESRKEFQNLEKRILQKEENLDKKSEALDKREGVIGKREKVLQQQEKELEENTRELHMLIEEQRKKLESLSGISAQQAKEMLARAIENEARHDAALMVKKIETEARETADRKAKNIISLAIQRYAGDYVAEKTVSVVNLPNEEMKGRIIGREGRNIRAIEASTGVDLIIDDTPEAVILSGFNPVRREVARVSLERLISDGRIHPARIEEIVEKVNIEIENAIKESGEQAAFDVGVHGIHPELIKLLGKLKYRTSYAQNVLQHSREVAFLCGIMAAELGINEKQAKRAGLLHDIGKAIDHEMEGPHATLGADLTRRYGEAPPIIHAIAAHHEDVPAEDVLAILVQAADALSGARPGARKELLETYVKRLEDLERIAGSFPGINKAYAIQAGRELRIIVESGQVNDADVVLLSRDIAKKIEGELTYPGQIKVTVIRETRAVEYAK